MKLRKRTRQVHVPDELRSLLVPISSLHFDPNNARIHNAANIEAVRKSLLTFGQYRPAIVRAQDRTIYVSRCLHPPTEYRCAYYQLQP